MGRHVDRFVDRHVGIHVGRHMDRHMDRCVDRHVGIHVDKHMDRHVGRHVDIHVGRRGHTRGQTCWGKGQSFRFRVYSPGDSPKGHLSLQVIPCSGIRSDLYSAAEADQCGTGRARGWLMKTTGYSGGLRETITSKACRLAWRRCWK